MDSHSSKTREQYQLTVSPQRFFEVYKIDYLKDNDPELYEYRIANPHPHHPKIVKIENKTLYYSVILEHTPYRLEDIQGHFSSKTQRPVINLVAEAILGFESLHKRFGAFKIKSTLIGFDKKWGTKVWLNNNFAKNHINPFDHMASDSEETMIKSIVGIFEQHGFEDDQLRTATSWKEAMRILVGKVTDEVKNELINVLSEKAREKEREKEKQKEKEKYKQTEREKNKQKQRQKNDYDIPTTPKHKSKEEGSFNDKNKHNSRQQHFQFPDRPILQHKIPKIPKVSEQTNVPDRSDKKTKHNHQEHTSNKQLHQSYTQQYSMSNDDFLIIRREIEVPQLIDEASVKDFLGCSINSYEAKMKLINFILQNNDAQVKVKQLASIFEYALTKDPDLYKSLLTQKGNISHLSVSDKEKVNKIRRQKQANSNLKLIKPCSDKQDSKKKQLYQTQYTNKLSEDIDDIARKNIHFLPNQFSHSSIQSHRPIPKGFTMKEGSFRPFNINSDRIQIPSRSNILGDDFAMTHSEIPARSDYKLNYCPQNKQDNSQPRSHEKNSFENPKQQKPFAPQITVTKNPNKDVTNFRDQVLKFIGKQ